ncbi:sulfurtransferase [Pedobacter insulae]|uniref:Thiosulfate/3-mercaptopyruvate sulfurtransferase n=1 Tax=Pedobacter insulae TaxID=414048 RepID=A0A1I3A9Z1_9SPHI|nr:sulfurtransferase [Pedobacter insulae]SFH46549.1 thiosulfate/3-mercaptopyruvate sulfurtransferase [Pedobacter insulae]
MHENSPLVNPQWLFENRNNPLLIILDVSLSNPIKSSSAEDDKIIPNALKFDWDKFSSATSDLPHMMPSENEFTAAAQELGINNNSLLVVYDRVGVYSSPRVWWMFRAMGFKNCYVLNGGLPLWLRRGFDYSHIHALPTSKGDFKGVYQSQFFVNFQEVLNALDAPDKIIIDARSAGRFNGSVSEPRQGLRAGHIPNSINIPFEEVLAENEMGTTDKLENIFQKIGPKDSHLIFSCGSGVTACIDALAATLIGFQNISIYDGSWSEWGMKYTKNPA